MKNLFLFLLIINLIHCQEMNKTPEFHVEISSPNSKYRIEPIFDKIKTLEEIPAGLPYGGSSGDWGQSGACPGLGWEALLLCSFDD
jgi:hypothetical protein